MNFAIDKEKLLSKVLLYVIADKKVCGDKNIEEVISQAIDGGAQMIQYRDKESDDEKFFQIASRLKEICTEKNVPFIINDRVIIALKTGADGVHLGQEDLSMKEARGILGSEKILGKSAETIQQAKEAEEEGADYVGIGPIFHTPSKQIKASIGTDIILKTKGILRIPFFAIGGINLNNLDQIVQAGGKRIAVISAIASSDDMKSSAEKLLEKLRYRNLS